MIAGSNRGTLVELTEGIRAREARRAELIAPHSPEGQWSSWHLSLPAVELARDSGLRSGR